MVRREWISGCGLHWKKKWPGMRKAWKRLAAVGMALCITGVTMISEVGSVSAAPVDSSFDMSASSPGEEDWTKLRLDLGGPESSDGGPWGTPIGNGVFGAKQNGGVAKDVFPLNHSTFWSGDPAYGDQLYEGGNGSYGNTPEERRAAYDELRQMLVDAYQEGISDEDRLAIFKKVEAQTKKIWDAQCAAQSTFLPLGRMILDFPDLTAGDTEDYSRILDMDGATSEISFKKDGVTYNRQAFISNPDNVMAVKLGNDGTRKMNMNVSLELPSEMVGKSEMNKITVDTEKNEIVMTGRAPYDKVGNYATWAEDRGTTFEARVKVLPVNGTTTASGNTLKVTDADEIVLLYSCETSYKDFKTDPAKSGIDVSGNVRRDLDAAVAKGYDKLLEDHQADFRSLFRRLWIDMEGESISYSGTNITPFEYARHFQYGRYISLCCGRENSQTNQNPVSYTHLDVYKRQISI